MRYFIVSFLTLFVCGPSLSFAQTNPTDTSVPATKFCSKNPKDPCCDKDAIEQPACLYAKDESNGGSFNVVFGGVFTAGIPRPDVLDAIQKDPKTGYQNLIQQNKAVAP